MRPIDERIIHIFEMIAMLETEQCARCHGAIVIGAHTIVCLHCGGTWWEPGRTTPEPGAG